MIGLFSSESASITVPAQARLSAAISFGLSFPPRANTKASSKARKKRNRASQFRSSDVLDHTRSRIGFRARQFQLCGRAVFRQLPDEGRSVSQHFRFQVLMKRYF